MKITFLGTAAANAFPEAFCTCGNCEQARRLGGRSLRKRSSILINDDLLIDLGPDIMAASQMHGCSLVNVRYCLQTHPHADHLDLSHLLSRSPGFGVVGAPTLNFYDCRSKPARTDGAGVARVLYVTASDYPARWHELAELLSPEAIRKGALDRFVESAKAARGTLAVDAAFLAEICESTCWCFTRLRRRTAL